MAQQCLAQDDSVHVLNHPVLGCIILRHPLLAGLKVPQSYQGLKMRQHSENQCKAPEDSMGSMGSILTTACLLLQSSIKFIKVKLTISILGGAITGFNRSNAKKEPAASSIIRSKVLARLPAFCRFSRSTCTVRKFAFFAINRFSLSMFRNVMLAPPWLMPPKL